MARNHVYHADDNALESLDAAFPRLVGRRTGTIGLTL